MKIRYVPVKSMEKITRLIINLSSKQKLKNPKKIGVIITFPLGNGDLVGAFPFLKSLRNHYSNAEIHLITDMDFFDGLPTIDKLIYLPGTFETGKPKLFSKKIIKGFKKLSEEKYDLVIIPERAINQLYYLKLLKPKQYIAYFGYKIDGNVQLQQKPVWNKSEHFWDMSLKIGDALGIKRIETLTKPEFNNKTKTKVDKIFQELNIKRKVIAINPHVNWESRRWDENNYVKLIEKIHKNYDIILYDAIYTTKWPNYIQKKLAKKGIKVHNIAGKMNIKEAYYFLSKVDMLITSDCGPMHYAFTLNTPTISFFGPVEPWNRLPKDYLEKKIHYAFWYNDYANGGLYDYESTHIEKGMNGLKAIPADEVAKKVNQFFSQGKFSYDDVLKKPVNCPICNNNKFNHLKTIKNLEGQFSLKKCQKCDLVFINPLPSINRLKNYYNKEYGVPLYQQKKVINKGNKVLEMLNNKGIKKGKLFELGASHGFFLNQAKKKGYQVSGVELSTTAVKNAKKKFNIEIENETFESSKIINHRNEFDAVVMFDLLEHLTNPNEVLQGLYNIMKKNGLIALTVPNIDSYEYKIYGKYWEWLSPPAHLFYYSPKTITKILKKSGFKEIEVITYKGDSAGNLLFHTIIAMKNLMVNLGIKLGKKEAIVNIRNQMTINERTLQNNEFTGIIGNAHKLTEIIGKPLKPLTNHRNRQGKGPTILVVGKK